ncbi:MAG TPA: carboxypeptidase regulatory-like domain-containing protein [Thermoanaerobaculia bacterium]|nr:carboxypeptidase regulatory-like domain-containing protein [Thermoanaerobaculia bacterium]
MKSIRAFTILFCAVLIAAPLLAAKGVVLSETGDPVAGARVEALATHESTSPIASATTDASGNFALDLKAEAFVLLSASASGYAPARKLVRGGFEDVMIELVSRDQKSGTVRSAKGPVSGAKILVIDGTGDVLATYDTDEHGHYSMPDPKLWVAGLCARHPDYAMTCRSIGEDGAMMGESLSLDFTLDGGRLVSGHVLSSAGKPVANAKVTAGRLTTTTTHDDGSFALRLSKEEKTIRAIAGDSAGGASAAATDVTITLAKGGTVAGSVRDDAGHALAGARVMVQEADDTSGWTSAPVNARGEYVIAPLAAGNYGIYVEAPEQYEIEPKQADLRKKNESRVDFVAKKTTPIHGVVRDENRRPVVGAIVTQAVDGMPLIYAVGPAFGTRTISGPDGTFKLYSGIPQGRLTAVKRGFAAGLSEALNPASVQKSVTITLPRGIEVKGTVVAAGDKPVSGAAVIVMSSATTFGAMPIAASLAAGVIDGWVHTDANGSFSIRLNSGMHDFGVWKRGYASRDIGSVEVSETMEPVRVVLEPAVSIRGHVARKGNPVAGGIVVATEQSQRAVGQAQVGSGGEFVFDSLQPGTYTLQYMNEHTRASKVSEAPATGVVIDLPETLDIRGRVTDSGTGTPIRQFKVTVRGGDTYDSNDVDDPDGQFEQSVGAGELELKISAPGYTTATRTILIAEGKAPTPLNVTLLKGRKISGRVVSKEGKPIAEVSVAAQQEFDGSASDEDGEFVLDSAPVDAIELSFYKQGYVNATKSIAAGTADQRMEITLDSGLKVTGRVVDKTGAPVEEAQVNASSSEGFGNTTTDKSGAFTISGLSSGTYSFTAQKSGFGQGKLENVDVTKAAPLLLTLGSDPTGTIRGSITGGSTGGWVMAMVTASAESGGSANAQAGRDGKFVIENAPVGEVSVRGMLMGIQRQSSTKEVKVVVPAGGEVDVQLAASAGDVTVRGTVKSAGAPVAGSSVTFSSLSTRQGVWTSPTAGDGSYEVTGLEAGRYDVSISGVGSRPYSMRTDLTSSTTLDINVNFIRIEGRVIDDRGAGIEGASVSASASSDQHSSIDATTDATGAFALNVQGDSAYRIAAKKKTFAIATAEVPSGSAGPVLLQLHHTAGAHVRLVDSQTRETLNGFVVVRDPTGKIQIPTSGDREEDGSLLLPLMEGSYLVSASAGDYASQTIKLSVPSDEATIPLSRGGTLVVHSADDAHELIKLVMPNGDEYVRCYCNGIAEIRLTGATTRVDHVAPGVYRMQVIDELEVTKRSYPIVITEGQTTTVDATK